MLNLLALGCNLGRLAKLNANYFESDTAQAAAEAFRGKLANLSAFLKSICAIVVGIDEETGKVTRIEGLWLESLRQIFSTGRVKSAKRRNALMPVIEGNAQYIAEKDFKPKIEKCLELLKSKAGTYHGWISTNVVKIRAFSKSGADVTKSSIDIAKLTFDASETWLASVLVHETHHIRQFKDKKDYVGKAAELECNQYQLETLRLIGAPEHEITYLLKQDGNHFDLNGDGKYDEKDYRLRKW